MSKSLLPTGIKDILYPNARKQFLIIASLLTTFDKFGYNQVNPPMVEYTETLLQGKGKTLSNDSFKFPDPISGQMMAIRADITTQISRIARREISSNATLPIRLSYNGDVMRANPESGDINRQLTQTGFEIIGIDGDSTKPQNEAISLIIEALENIGINDIVIDFKIAGLLEKILADNSDRITEIQSIINKKEFAKLPNELPQIQLIKDISSINGDAISAIKKLENIANLPDFILNEINQLKSLIESINLNDKNASLQLDILENNGFEYHRGICFSIFSKSSPKEIGRGGNYLITNDNDKQPIQAIGATLYTNRLTTISSTS